MSKLQYSVIGKCRNCNSSSIFDVMKLGNQFLTGVFPKSPGEIVTNGPVDLAWCEKCALLQMRQSYDVAEMYGDNYGYRSGLNASMVKHLTAKIQKLERVVNLKQDDLVIDIGSNDATSLRAYSGNHLKVGIDPTGKKFASFYSGDIKLIPDFFSKEVFFEEYPGRKAKIVTSIAMFYDLEDPNQFIRDVTSVLDDDGVWHFEQSYMPSMLRTNSYDTICHEHLEFYSLNVINSMLERAGLRILDVEFNDVNGGSFAISACKNNSKNISNKAHISWILNEEDKLQLNTISPYLSFCERAKEHRESLRSLILALVNSGKTILGYGASTKGNVLLQYCGLSSAQIPFIAEVNEEKFGSFTPGTNIPIISEAEAHAMKPDYFLVLPWHFKNSIVERESAFLLNGGKFIFPLPYIEIV
jgi:thiol-disulfide isomerase/thioredoxin